MYIVIADLLKIAVQQVRILRQYSRAHVILCTPVIKVLSAQSVQTFLPRPTKFFSKDLPHIPCIPKMAVVVVVLNRLRSHLQTIR